MWPVAPEAVSPELTGRFDRVSCVVLAGGSTGGVGVKSNSLLLTGARAVVDAGGREARFATALETGLPPPPPILAAGKEDVLLCPEVTFRNALGVLAAGLILGGDDIGVWIGVLACLGFRRGLCAGD